MLSVVIAAVVLAISFWIYREKRWKRILEASVLEKFGPETEMCQPNDYMWKMMEQETNMCIINSIMIVDHLTAKVVAQTFQRIISQNHYRRFRQRLILYKGAPVWIMDDCFDIKWHVTEEKNNCPSNEEELNIWAGRNAGEPMPIDRPLWSVKVVPNYRKNNDGNMESVILFRIHHVIGDGISLATMIFNMLKTEEETKIAENESTCQSFEEVKTSAFSTQVNKKQPKNLWLLRIYAWVMVIPLSITLFFRPKDKNIFTGFTPQGKRFVATSGGYPLAKVKAIKNKLNMTVNDVVMGVFGAALNRTLKHLNAPATPYFKIYMPINMRTDNGVPVLENNFVTPFIRIPTTTGDPVAACKLMKVNLDQLKLSIEPLSQYLAADFVARYFPTFLGRWFIQRVAGKCTAIFSNVPGPQDIMYLNGRKVKDAFFWVPTTSTMLMGFSVGTMGGKVGVGCIIDSAAGDYAKVVCEEYVACMEDLEKSVLLSNER